MDSARASEQFRPPRGDRTIDVNVTLLADLKRFAPPGVDGPHRRIIAAGATVADLLAAMGIPEDCDLTVGLDGEIASRDDVLRDGTEVILLGPMEGG